MKINAAHRMTGVALGVVTLVLGSIGFATAGFSRTDRVQAYQTDIWTVWAASGSSRLFVDGDGDTDLDCYVYSRDGSLLGKDDDLTDLCIVNFHQRYSGNVKVHIKNLGAVYNEYTIVLE